MLAFIYLALTFWVIEPTHNGNDILSLPLLDDSGSSTLTGQFTAYQILIQGYNFEVYSVYNML